MEENKIELLAPAGNYEIFLLAIKAGADAVYFAGPKFGARAFAQNFTEDEVVEAIQIAHLFHKKVYLTVNTLFKELELQTLSQFLMPYYLEGLDGVIVQDIGVLDFIKKTFPNMEIHASTQMAITGTHGVKLLETIGVQRVVLARELSLNEIRDIKKNTNMELEIFIHGAMCYSYSGQCLLSSILGGRSGNRGRCAQPCRLPYQIDHGETNYPLSMKDQCAITFLEELITIGVDSLKIEGRMKKPEYVAKVTSIYRKYIDMIYKKRSENDFSHLEIEQKDQLILENLYVRNSVQNGYFNKQNGREMVTLENSTYKETPASLLKEIQKEFFIQKPLKLLLDCIVYLYVDKPIKLSITYQNKKYDFEGELVLLAKTQPLTDEKIKKQINKTKNTPFEFSKLTIQTDSQSFIPVSAINAIRRIALEEIKLDLLLVSKRAHPVAQINANNNSTFIKKKPKESDIKNYSILISKKEQLQIAIRMNPKRIYIPINLFESLDEKNELQIMRNNSIEIFLSLPHVFRQKDTYLESKWEILLNNSFIDGVLIRNIEEVGFIENINYQGIKQLDYLIYCMNYSSINFWKNREYNWTCPLELNRKELTHLTIADETMIYGRIPLMITANCITKTQSCCTKKEQTHILTDRINKDFPVISDCENCFNIIYNSVPLSLHKFIHSFHSTEVLRLEFTIETPKECEAICHYFFKKEYLNLNNPYIKEYTNGHFNRGID